MKTPDYSTQNKGQNGMVTPPKGGDGAPTSPTPKPDDKNVPDPKKPFSANAWNGMRNI